MTGFVMGKPAAIWGVKQLSPPDLGGDSRGPPPNLPALWTQHAPNFSLAHLGGWDLGPPEHSPAPAASPIAISGGDGVPVPEQDPGSRCPIHATSSISAPFPAP